MTDSAKAAPRLKQRKTPRQERSIQRLDAILTAAKALIVSKGVSAMKMTEIAEEAGIPIGSLYQFFPQKAAVLRALHDTHTQQVEAGAAAGFRDIETREQAIALMETMFDRFYAIYSEDPVYMPMWLAGMADPDLQRLNASHLGRLTDIVFKSLEHLVPAECHEDFKIRVNLQLYLTGAIQRFAMNHEEELALRQMEEWKAMVRSTFFSFD